MSLSVLIKKLRFKNKITEEECDELLKKLKGHDIEIYNKAIKEYQDKLSKEMHDLWRFYKADSVNRPKPDFMTAYSMITIIADSMKEGKEE